MGRACRDRVARRAVRNDSGAKAIAAAMAASATVMMGRARVTLARTQDASRLCMWGSFAARDMQVTRTDRNWLDVGCGTGALCEVILQRTLKRR